MMITYLGLKLNQNLESQAEIPGQQVEE